MNTSRFVCGSSLILAGWLAATFLNEVPSQRYPKLDKKPETALVPEKATDTVLTIGTKKAELPATALH